MSHIGRKNTTTPVYEVCHMALCSWEPPRQMSVQMQDGGSAEKQAEHAFLITFLGVVYSLFH